MVCIAAYQWMSACLAEGSKVTCWDISNMLDAPHLTSPQTLERCLQVSMRIVELNEVESTANPEDSSICSLHATIKQLQGETAESGKCTYDKQVRTCVML